MPLRAKVLEERRAERHTQDVSATRRNGRRHDARDVLGGAGRVGVVPDLDTHVARHGRRARGDDRVLAGRDTAEADVDLGANPLAPNALIDVRTRGVDRAGDRQGVRRRIPAARAGAERAIGRVDHRDAEARRAHAVGAAGAPGRGGRRDGRVAHGGDGAGITHRERTGVRSVGGALGAGVAARENDDEERENGHGEVLHGRLHTRITSGAFEVSC